VAPNVTPSEEEDHGDLRDQEATQESLSTNNWHEEVGRQAASQTVFEAAHLVLRYPVFAVLKVNLGAGRDSGFVDEEVHKLKGKWV
jgi:hypothetical protein